MGRRTFQTVAGNIRQLKEGARSSWLGTRLSLTVSTFSLKLFLFGTRHCTKHLFDAFTIINQHSLMCYDKKIWKALFARMSRIFFSLLFLLKSRQVTRMRQWPGSTLDGELLNSSQAHERRKGSNRSKKSWCAWKYFLSGGLNRESQQRFAEIWDAPVRIANRLERAGSEVWNSATSGNDSWFWPDESIGHVAGYCQWSHPVPVGLLRTLPVYPIAKFSCNRLIPSVHLVTACQLMEGT